jgi:hypothetical protein
VIDSRALPAGHWADERLASIVPSIGWFVIRFCCARRPRPGAARRSLERATAVFCPNGAQKHSPGSPPGAPRECGNGVITPDSPFSGLGPLGAAVALPGCAFGDPGLCCGCPCGARRRRNPRNTSGRNAATRQDRLFVRPAGHCPYIRRTTAVQGQSITLAKSRPLDDWAAARAQAMLPVAADRSRARASMPRHRQDWRR